MQWKKFVERTIWALWLLVFGGAGLCVVVGSIGFFSKNGWLPIDAAAWVQAVGSVAAILVAALIASGDRSFTKKNIRAREKVVIRAVEERCVDAYGALSALNYRLRNHFRPVNQDSPAEVKSALQRVEEVLRDLQTIDLMSMPTTEVVECVLAARAIVQICKEFALEGWDPALVVEVHEYSPLEGLCSGLMKPDTHLGENARHIEVDIGVRLSGDAASEIGCNGLASGCSQITTYRAQRTHTRILRIASRHAPKAGAVCGSSARTDLCGGWQVTAIPTATFDL